MIFRIFLLGLIVCLTVKVRAQNQISPEGEIVFLFFAKNGNDILLKDYKIVVGSIATPIDHNGLENGYIKYSIEDKNGYEIYKSTLRDPLSERVEYVDDEGNWVSDEIVSQEKEFVIRVPYEELINNGNVIFESYQSNARSTAINKIPLPKFKR